MKAMGLKSNELRIGNYVNHSDFNTPVMVSGLILEDSRPRVAIINGSTTFLVGGDWSAIPLTEEWLIEFGFIKGYNDIDNHDFFEIPEWGKIRIDNGYLQPAEYYFLDGLSNEIKYIHQLQNLYFALTSEELTIKE